MNINQIKKSYLFLTHPPALFNNKTKERPGGLSFISTGFYFRSRVKS